MGSACRQVQGQVTLSVKPVHTSPNFSLIQHFITKSSHPPAVLSANSVHPCSVRQGQGLASAGQDPAIIEHVQGSASFSASAWHLPPGTYWLPFPSMSQEPELKTNLTITAQQNKHQSPHSSDIPLTLADQQEPAGSLTFPGGTRPATGGAMTRRALVPLSAARLLLESTLPLCLLCRSLLPHVLPLPSPYRHS